MESSEKEIYDAPAVVIVEAPTEGIVCASEPEGKGHGYSGWD